MNFSNQSSDRDSASSAREGEGGRHSFYTLHNVRKIDNYSRRIFPTLYVLFVLYFFIRLRFLYSFFCILYTLIWSGIISLRGLFQWIIIMNHIKS